MIIAVVPFSDAGAIVEQGAHDELMDRGGTYARLIDAQISAEGNGPDEAASAAT